MRLSYIRWSNYSNFCAAILHANLGLLPHFQRVARTEAAAEQCWRSSRITKASMPKLPIFRLRTSEPPTRPDLRYYKPVLAFSDLQLGVDNLRYDVLLANRITQDLRFHLSRYICRFGEVESLLEMDVPAAARTNFIQAPQVGCREGS